MLNPNRLRIAISIPCLLYGGTELQTLSLVRCLKALGHNLFIICYFDFENSIVIKFREAGAEVVILRLGRKDSFLKITVRVRNELKSLNPDIVHVQYMAPGALPIFAARLAGVRTVLATVHHPHTASHGWISKLILRFASLLTTRFIAVSMNAEKSWFGTAAVYNESLSPDIQAHHFTIYNTVDIDKISKIAESADGEKMKSELKIPLNVPLIGVVARLRHEKGIDLLVSTCCFLKKDGIDFHLLIVGSGPDEASLKDQVQLGGVSEFVTFYGAAEWETAMKLMAIMNIVAVPSRFEGFGLTAAEAMAAGKPVIASDSFGLKEVVADHETGLLFKGEDISDLQEKLKTLLNDPVLCKQYGTEGQIRARSLFDTTVFMKSMNSLYGSYLL
jgi:L-malate glycosyltransferase